MLVAVFRSAGTIGRGEISVERVFGNWAANLPRAAPPYVLFPRSPPPSLMVQSVLRSSLANDCARTRAGFRSAVFLPNLEWGIILPPRSKIFGTKF